MVDLRRTVILITSADWKLWLHVVKSLAEGGKSNVWQYVNPANEHPVSLPAALIELVKALYETTTSAIAATATTPALPAIMALTRDAFTRYRFEMSEFYRKTTEYKDIPDLIVKVRTHIYFTIAATNIIYIYDQTTEHGMLRAL